MASNGGDASELTATANGTSASSTARGEAAGEAAGEGADGAAAAEHCSVTGAGTKKQAAKGKWGERGEGNQERRRQE